jgi:serine/threonine protein phosphatase PrpC
VDPYQSALLLGSDHPGLGEVAVTALGDHMAIGLSRGRFPKGYSHVDPNEDAVFAATNGTASGFAVADGHNGFDAAQAALEAIAEAAPQVLGAPLALGVERLVTVAADRVRSVVSRLEPPRNRSGTALTICLTRPDEMATATMGDSGYVLATKRRVRTERGQSRFLTPGTDVAGVAIDVVSLPGHGLVVAASDGLFDFTRDTLSAALGDSTGTTPEDTVMNLLELAGRGGAGDHLSIAVLRLG